MTLALSSTSCDRLVKITGNVYEWVDPPPRAGSLVFDKQISPIGILKENVPEGLTLKPLQDVQVRAYGQYKTDTFFSNEITDSKGAYKLTISLGYKTDSYDSTIEATHPGFMSVKRVITDVGNSHFITIILVPERAAAE
jgi:hypothetical protein